MEVDDWLCSHLKRREEFGKERLGETLFADVIVAAGLLRKFGGIIGAVRQ
jgi:hypothetical protein